MEFSKLLTLIANFIWGILIVLIIVLPNLGLTIDGLVSIFPDVSGVVAVIDGFYFWKNKNANRSKYAMKYVNRFADKYGMEWAVRIAEVVLKD